MSKSPLGNLLFREELQEVFNIEKTEVYQSKESLNFEEVSLCLQGLEKVFFGESTSRS